jgi:quercetin dioxygenase-like cupin family protein
MNRDARWPARDCHWHECATLHVLGELSAVESQVYLDHLPQCGACAQELELAQQIVARVDLSTASAEGESADVAPTAARVRKQLLDAVAREPRTAAASPQLDRTWRNWTGSGAAAASEAIAPGLHNIDASAGAWEPIGIEGIEVKRLSVDAERRYVTMLVRMAPGTAYPGHRHAGAEECFVVSGDVRVGERVLRAGDYQLAAAGSVHGVQSTESGCTLFIVSSQDDELV